MLTAHRLQPFRLHLIQQTGWQAVARLSKASSLYGRYAVLGGARCFALRLPRSHYYREPPDGLTPIPVAIVGRPNVGKSTLFNRLQSGTKKKKTPIARNAIVSNRPGTTRDRKDATAVFGGLLLRIIDTGGLESQDRIAESSLLASMQDQVCRAVAEAAAVLFVINAREGITPLDLEIAEMLKDEGGNIRRYKDLFANTTNEDAAPVILVANHAEGAFIGPYLNDCYELDAGDPVAISAYHNEGMDDLYERLCLEIGHLQGGDDEDDDDASADSEAEHTAAEFSDEMSDEDVSQEDLDIDHDTPQPNLKWMPPNSLTEEQKRSLRYWANHPADPLGKLDEGLKASVLHKTQSDVKNFWLAKPQRSLPKEDGIRDFVMEFRRLEEMERPMRIAVVGLPSSGKSSLINALLQEERCVVDATDGTTMDAIVSDWTFKDQPVKLIDTCGISRGWKYPGTYSDLLEPGMGTRKAVRRAHVVVLCIDAHRNFKMLFQSTPSNFEVRLGNFAVEEGKCLIIALNKWDLIDEEHQATFRAQILAKITEKFSQVKGVPVVFISTKYNLNLATLMTRSLSLYKRWNARLPTGKLNDWLQAWMIRWPPPWRHGQKRTVKYITQTRARPPSFVLWSNTTAGEFPKNYLRQLQNAMREEFRISGVPLRMVIRTTMMPKPRKKLKKADVLRWKRVGPQQAEAVMNLTSKRTVRRRQTE